MKTPQVRLLIKIMWSDVIKVVYPSEAVQVDPV